MKDKLLNIPGYDVQCYRCMQSHFSEVVRKFLKLKGNTKERNYSNLFQHGICIQNWELLRVVECRQEQ